MSFLTIACVAVLATVATVSAAPQPAYVSFYPLKSSRITNGQNAVPNAYPYQVALQFRLTPLGRFQQHCGGSIITRDWVLTAAHCFTELPRGATFNVLAGKHNLNIVENTEQSRLISRIINHPLYQGGVAPHDIALARLASPLNFNNAVSAISLPARNALHSGNAVLSGWGSISLTTTPVRPSVLQMAIIPIVDTARCWNILNNIVPNPPLNARTLDNVCAGPLDNSRVSACSGDSGGPLAQTVGRVVQLVGIVSWGISPCGTIGVPSVFVRTSAYIDWIARQMATN